MIDKIIVTPREFAAMHAAASDLEVGRIGPDEYLKRVRGILGERRFVGCVLRAPDDPMPVVVDWTRP